MWQKGSGGAGVGWGVWGWGGGNNAAAQVSWWHFMQPRQRQPLQQCDHRMVLSSVSVPMYTNATSGSRLYRLECSQGLLRSSPPHLYAAPAKADSAPQALSPTGSLLHCCCCCYRACCCCCCCLPAGVAAPAPPLPVPVPALLHCCHGTQRKEWGQL